MDNYLRLPIGDSAPEIVTSIVEIPQDSVNKYEYDLNLKVFVLDRTLHSPIHYPGDYGFITQTIAEDGDPLDILREIEHSFAVYKDLEATRTQVLGWSNRDAAYRVIQSCHKHFNSKFASQ